jgi:orotate phosphoribosyltransferase
MTILDVLFSSAALALLVGLTLFFFLRREEGSMSTALEAGRSRSRWALVEGGESPVYYDLDKALADPTTAAKIVNFYEEMISDLVNECGPVQRMAFIEKRRGPVGAICLKDLLVQRTGLPAVIVRPRRRIRCATVKGITNFGETAIVVSDVATSGGTVLEAVDKLEARGVRAVGVVVFLVRDRATEQALGSRGIRLKYVADQQLLERPASDTNEAANVAIR